VYQWYVDRYKPLLRCIFSRVSYIWLSRYTVQKLIYIRLNRYLETFGPASEPQIKFGPDLDLKSRAVYNSEPDPAVDDHRRCMKNFAAPASCCPNVVD